MADDPQIAIGRGQHAKRILDDPLVKEALEHVEAVCVSDWINTGPGDAERREQAWQMLHSAREFVAKLRDTINTGKIEAHDVKLREVNTRG